MKLRHHLSFFRAAPAVAFLVLAQIAAGTARARAQNPTSAANPFWGSVTAQPVTSGTLKLSLQGALRRGLSNNLGLKEAENSEKALHGERNQALQEFLPTIWLSGDTGYHMYNLAAQGFNSAALADFAALLPGGKALPNIPLITRDYLTEGQIHFSQILFSGPVIQAWKASGAAEEAARLNKMSAREEVVQQVATAYLRTIADQSEVDNARALVAEAQVLLDHVHAAHEAGTAANLDELRARVELEAQQQALITAENRQAKDLILLKREIGVDPGQQVDLTDPAPYSDLAVQTPEEVRALAYRSRQDYLSLQNEAVEYKSVHAVYRSERLPTLSFNSYYGTSTVNGAGTRGNWMAMGTLSFPIFREARLRGDEDASRAQMHAVEAQLADLRNQIDEQVRAALLDVNANKKLVDMAQSNVDLARRALSDETDRVNAGVDDNLPLVTAQATLATAESNLVESLYQYNVSKLGLARAAGVLEQQYQVYLGH
ncbi:MAG: TolC family protein [Terracidiphilus sp.]